MQQLAFNVFLKDATLKIVVLCRIHKNCREHTIIHFFILWTAANLLNNNIIKAIETILFVQNIYKTSYKISWESIEHLNRRKQNFLKVLLRNLRLKWATQYMLLGFGISAIFSHFDDLTKSEWTNMFYLNINK